MLRTIFVAVIIIVGLAYAVRQPFYALLFYLWLAYFRPEQWVWNDWISSLNLSFWVGLLLIGSSAFSGARFHLRHRTWLLFAFAAQCILASAASWYGDYAWRYLQEFLKVILISYLLTVLVDNIQKLRATILVMSLSLGMEAAKQGWANFVRNPGGANNNPIPFLGDNNGVAIGMFMLMPLVFALAQTTSIRRNKLAYRFLGVGVFIRGLTTYSRGAFLSAAAFAVFYITRTKRKVLTLVMMAFVGYIAFSVMPPEYWNRMRTVEASEDGTRDESSAGRLHYWEVAMIMAKARPLVGVGFNCFSQAYDEYDPARGEFGTKRAPHSTWFGTVGDLGYPGLILLLALIVSSFFGAWKAERIARRVPELNDLAPFALGLQSSLVVMVVGGTFLHMQYAEMLWHYFALSMVMQRLAAEAVAPATATSPARVTVPGPGGVPRFDPRPSPSSSPSTAAYASAPRPDPRPR